MEDLMNLLVAVELDQKADEKVISKALDLVKYCNFNLNLVHVVDPVCDAGMISSQVFLDCLQNHEECAREKIAVLGSIFGVPKEFQFVKIGLVKEEIADLVKMIHVDLLVMGNHGRHGFDALFRWNNTVSLVRHADCDMLAVRVA